LEQSDPDVSSYVDDVRVRLEILVHFDLVHFDPTTKQYQITLDGPGWAYEEEICSLFVPQDIVDQIRAKGLPWWTSQSSSLSFNSTVAMLCVAESMELLSLLI
jgi:hypothetical protein